MKRLFVNGAILVVLSVGSSFVAAAPLGSDVSALAVQRVDDLVPHTPVVIPQSGSTTEGDEPVAVPLPTAAQAGMMVFAMAAMWRLARRIRLAA